MSQKKQPQLVAIISLCHFTFWPLKKMEWLEDDPAATPFLWDKSCIVSSKGDVYVIC